MGTANKQQENKEDRQVSGLAVFFATLPPKARIVIVIEKMAKRIIPKQVSLCLKGIFLKFG